MQHKTLRSVLILAMILYQGPVFAYNCGSNTNHTFHFAPCEHGATTLPMPDPKAKSLSVTGLEVCYHGEDEMNEIINSYLCRNQTNKYIVAICDEKAQRLKKLQSKLPQRLKKCPQIATPSEYYHILRDKAVSGDIAAQRCYITAPFFKDRDMNNKTSISNEELAEYKVLMPKYLNEDLQRGDWSVISFINSNRNEHAFNILPALAYPMGLQMDSFKWGQLKTLGKKEPLLPYDERIGAKAEYDQYTAWAVDMFNKYFKPIDPDHPSPPLCPDLAEID